MKNIFLFPLLLILFSSVFLFPLPLQAGQDTGLSKGQTIYVPVYSHIYSGDRELSFLLTVTLSIRNVNPKDAIEVTLVDYHETQGKLVKKYLEKPIFLNPMESVRYIIPEKDKAGSGANFIVEWKADKSVNPPIVESIMIGTQSSQGISFTSRGKAILPTAP